MAGRGQDLVNKLADRGEDAIARMGEIPGAGRLLEVADSLRRRLDELQRRLQRLDVVEQRVAALEARVEELTASKPPPQKTSAKTAAATTESARKRVTEKPPRPTQGPKDKLPE